MTERLARCARCGAPAAKTADPGGKLVALRGYRGRPLYSPRRRGGLRRPIGYVHSDREFCDRRIPKTIRGARKPLGR